MDKIPPEGRDFNARPAHGEAGPPETLAARIAPEIAAQVAACILPALRSEMQKAAAPDPLLSIEEVAAWLAVSPRTAEKLVAAGKLSPLWIGGQRRFTRPGVEAYLRSTEARRTTARKRRPHTAAGGVR